MPLTDQIISGSITIRQVDPSITSEGLARSSGYVLMPYRDIMDTMQRLEGMYTEDELTENPERGIAKMYARLANTRQALDEFIEQHED
nr:hypothetical protein 2 [Balneolaceae bacterium]